MFNSDVACQECKYFYMMIYNIRSFPGFFPQTFCTKNIQFSSTHTEMNPIFHVSSTGTKGRYKKIFVPRIYVLKCPLTCETYPIPLYYSISKHYMHNFLPPKKLSVQILMHCHIPLQVFCDFQGCIEKHRTIDAVPDSPWDKKVLLLCFHHYKCSVKTHCE